MLFSVCYTSAEGWNGPFRFQIMSFIVPENLKNTGVAEKYRAWFNQQVLNELRHF